MKPIQLNYDLPKGATAFIKLVNNDKISIQADEDTFHSAYKFTCDWCKGNDPTCTDCYGTGFIWDLDCESKEEFIKKYSLLQAGDKFFIQEEFNPNMFPHMEYLPASQMTYEQSRTKGTVISVECKRVKDLTSEEICKVCNWAYNEYTKTESWHKIYHTDFKSFCKLQKVLDYERNDYVFIYTFKEE